MRISDKTAGQFSTIQIVHLNDRKPLGFSEIPRNGNTKLSVLTRQFGQNRRDVSRIMPCASVVFFVQSPNVKDSSELEILKAAAERGDAESQFIPHSNNCSTAQMRDRAKRRKIAPTVLL